MKQIVILILMALSIGAYGQGKKIIIGVGGGGNGDVTLPQLNDSLATKQDLLISGTNIKTVEGVTLLGTGDLTISGAKNGNLDYIAMQNPSFSKKYTITAISTGSITLNNGDFTLPHTYGNEDNPFNRWVMTKVGADPRSPNNNIIITGRTDKQSWSWSAQSNQVAATLVSTFSVGSQVFLRNAGLQYKFLHNNALNAPYGTFSGTHILPYGYSHLVGTGNNTQITAYVYTGTAFRGVYAKINLSDNTTNPAYITVPTLTGAPANVGTTYVPMTTVDWDNETRPTGANSDIVTWIVYTLPNVGAYQKTYMMNMPRDIALWTTWDPTAVEINPLGFGATEGFNVGFWPMTFDGEKYLLGTASASVATPIMLKAANSTLDWKDCTWNIQWQEYSTVAETYRNLYSINFCAFKKDGKYYANLHGTSVITTGGWGTLSYPNQSNTNTVYSITPRGFTSVIPETRTPAILNPDGQISSGKYYNHHQGGSFFMKDLDSDNVFGFISFNTGTNTYRITKCEYLGFNRAEPATGDY